MTTTREDGEHGPRRPAARKGRGASGNPQPRFLAEARAAFDDGWTDADPALEPVATTITEEHARTILSRNDSPDVPFDASVNPYRGCLHGCAYCFARPSHAYLDLSPGLDFETKLFAKANAAELLRKELSAPNYQSTVIALGANTDPYQPIERHRAITRSILEVLAEFRNPLTIVTKSSLVERDMDLLAMLAADKLAAVYISVTTLNRTLARRMEPRATAPQRRIETIRRLSAVGIPVGVLFAPVIPALNDHELESVLSAAAEAGAMTAGYVLIRLAHELKTLFREWLDQWEPLKADHVMHRIREMRGGRDNDPSFGRRMRGTGVFADLLAQRFAKAKRRFGLDAGRIELDTSRFRRPETSGQLSLL
jgi:DNA repair photolyase